MKESIIIGIDLSFNSTGLTFTKFINNQAKTIEFHRLIFDDESNKIKKYVPTPIRNINQKTYRLPVNILVSDLIIDIKDYNSRIQMNSTIKAMICVKRLMDIICLKLSKMNGKFDLYINIEGFLMPQVQGENQFRSLSGLIMLQGMLRAEITKTYLSNIYNIDIFKFLITPPKELKLFFCGNGNADKQIMLEGFLDFWDGKKLLPDTSSLAKVNDIIDSFALMAIAYGKITGSTEIKERKKKVKKKKIDVVIHQDILKSSIPIPIPIL